MLFEDVLLVRGFSCHFHSRIQTEVVFIFDTAHLIFFSFMLHDLGTYLRSCCLVQGQNNFLLSTLENL